ncbi:MAG: TRAP transporter small permease [Xanthobacteraceae bacterium]
MKRWRDLISSICGCTAAVILSAMMLLTVADLTSRAIFNVPIRGVFEIIELLLDGTFFVALPCVFLRDENILVNSIDEYFPNAVPFLKRTAEILSAIVLAVIAWQGWIAAKDSFAFNDVTADLGIPRFYSWGLLLFGVVGAAIAALVMAFRRESQQ